MRCVCVCVLTLHICFHLNTLFEHKSFMCVSHYRSSSEHQNSLLMPGSLQDSFSLHGSCYISPSALLHYLVVCVPQDRLLASNWLGRGQTAQWRPHWCCNELWIGRPIGRQEPSSQAADSLAQCHGGLQVAGECGRVCGYLWRVESEREKDGQLIQQSSLRLWQWPNNPKYNAKSLSTTVLASLSLSYQISVSISKCFYIKYCQILESLCIGDRRRRPKRMDMKHSGGK